MPDEMWRTSDLSPSATDEDVSYNGLDLPSSVAENSSSDISVANFFKKKTQTRLRKLILVVQLIKCLKFKKLAAF